MRPAAADFPLTAEPSPTADYGWGMGMALQISGDGAEIQGNTVYNAGYSCLVAGGTNHIIENNRLERCCLLFDDGVGIYMGGSGHQVIGNTVIDSIGNAEGTSNQISWGARTGCKR